MRTKKPEDGSEPEPANATGVPAVAFAGSLALDTCIDEYVIRECEEGESEKCRGFIGLMTLRELNSVRDNYSENTVSESVSINRKKAINKKNRTDKKL